MKKTALAALCGAACGAALATGALLATREEPAPLICGAYTMANADLTGCEVLPEYLGRLTDEMRVFTAVNGG